VADVFRRASPLPALPRTPKVSVVVCTYNGSKTLAGALESVSRLNYPDYEVILVDDGSTDGVPEIAARYPQVRYHRQANRGLSVARNVGMELATGEIVAYTDDDCVADRDWLYFLVAKLLDSDASGVGGPNLLPTEDGPVAACVQVSPGAPAHVLVDDSVAEHVPGCNMAFWRDRLMAIGGFDPVYSKAGDDVDVCWRLEGEGEHVVYAPSAMVWHHRRSTVRAYLKQQRGYGEAEALLKRKHPEKFRGYRAQWMGRIYTRAGLGVNVGKPIIHRGVFGAGMFQTIYSPPQVWWPLVALSLEWWLAALMLLGLAPFANPLAWLARVGVLSGDVASPLANPLLLLPVLMLGATAGVAYLVAGQAQPAEHQRRFWSRLLIAAMHVAQPVERGWARYRGRFEDIRIPDALHRLRRVWEYRAGTVLRRREIALWSENWIGREELLKDLVDLAQRHHWFPRIDSGWLPHDVRFYGDRWCKADLVTVTENHGGPERLTRLRLVRQATLFQKALVVGLAYLAALAWAIEPRAILYVVPFILATLWQVHWSTRQLHTAVMAAALTTARQLGMAVVDAPELLARKPAGERDEVGAQAAPASTRLAGPLFWRRLWAAARRMSLTLF
jgi:glycosyltransferase involved in cell wall biosynthesis